jgi:hypothetical protein
LCFEITTRILSKMTGGAVSGQEYTIQEFSPEQLVWSDHEGNYVAGRPSQLAIELAAFACQVSADVKGEEKAQRMAGSGCSVLVIKRVRLEADDDDHKVAGYILYSALSPPQQRRSIFRRGEQGEVRTEMRITDFLFDPQLGPSIRTHAVVLDALGRLGLKLPEQMA